MLDSHASTTRFVDAPRIWCRINSRSPRCCDYTQTLEDGRPAWTAQVQIEHTERAYFAGLLGEVVDVVLLCDDRRLAGSGYVTVVEHGDDQARVCLRGATPLISQ